MKKIAQLINSILYHPIQARIFYDILTPLITGAMVWGIFLLFENNVSNLWQILLFPILFTLFNYIYGVYGRYKLSTTLVKSLILSHSAFTAFALIYFLSPHLLSLSLTTFFTILLTITPRWFLNFGLGKYKPAAPLARVIHDKQPILITGGGGYIGSHVAEQLLDAGFKVRIFDKFYYGRESIVDLEENSNLEIIEGDISDIFSLNLALQDVQAVVHLAGIVGDPACAVDDNLTRHINIITTRMLKETVRAFRIPKFIFASSCSVYGAADYTTDEMSELNPVSLYAQTKIDSEKELLQDPSDIFHPTILRFATVFGHSRRMRFDLVTNLFTAQAYKNGEITVFGGNQWRPLIHVVDIARAIVKVIQAPQEVVSRQIFNVGDDSLNITIGDLGELVGQTVGNDESGNKVRVSIQKKIDDPRNYHVSFEKIRKALGFTANYDFEAGVNEIVNHFKDGTYKQPYNDPIYSNVQMTKKILDEFNTEEYQQSHYSILSSSAMKAAI